MEAFGVGLLSPMRTMPSPTLTHEFAPLVLTSSLLWADSVRFCDEQLLRARERQRTGSLIWLTHSVSGWRHTLADSKADGAADGQTLTT